MRGDWHEGGVREEAEDLNQPLLTREVTGLALGATTPLTVDGIPAAFSGLKPAEDGKGLVFRIYEPAGRRGDLAVAAPRLVRRSRHHHGRTATARRPRRADALRSAELEADQIAVAGSRLPPLEGRDQGRGLGRRGGAGAGSTPPYRIPLSRP